MQNLSSQELKANIDLGQVMTLIDLQSLENYVHRHIPGAEHVQVLSLDNKEYMQSLRDKDAKIVLYDEFDELEKGVRIAEELVAAGYLHVFRLAGGMMGWMEQGYAVEGGQES